LNVARKYHYPHYFYFQFCFTGILSFLESFQVRLRSHQRSLEYYCSIFYQVHALPDASVSTESNANNCNNNNSNNDSNTSALFCVAIYFAVADVVKKALNMTVWGLVRTLPSAESRCSSVDEYR